MLDLQQLRSFLAISDNGSFTQAAEILGLSQSTVSLHLQRLETSLGRKLVSRNTHQVSLTPEGELLAHHARAMLAIDARVETLFVGQSLRGRLRLGVSEDFATSRLTTVLETFIARHPDIELQLTVALSGVLYEMQEDGELDLVFAKRRLGDNRGTLVIRDQLVWLSRDQTAPKDFPSPLPLIAFPQPSITRAIAIETLDRAGISWRIACTCASLSGLVAAARAGMGLMVQPRSMTSAGLKMIPAGLLPQLEDVEFVLVPRFGADERLIKAISDEITARLGPV